MTIPTGDTATQIANTVIGIVGAFSSWFDTPPKPLELSATQLRYLEQSRRQAAEALERARMQRELQFAREKQAVLDRMKGPKPVTLQMKGARLPGELTMKTPGVQAVDVALAQTTADRIRDRIERLRVDLDIDETGLLKFQRDNIAYRNTRPDTAVDPNAASAIDDRPIALRDAVPSAAPQSKEVANNPALTSGTVSARVDPGTVIDGKIAFATPTVVQRGGMMQFEDNAETVAFIRAAQQACSGDPNPGCAMVWAHDHKKDLPESLYLSRRNGEHYLLAKYLCEGHDDKKLFFGLRVPGAAMGIILVTTPIYSAAKNVSNLAGSNTFVNSPGTINETMWAVKGVSDCRLLPEDR